MTAFKVAVFVALMLVGGRRVVPWILNQVARTGSRELFTLAVLAIALGIAYGSAHLFDVSFALGAFFAGVVLAETDLSHQAAENSLPLQDAFAVLFFVSVGMLFDPSVVLERPLELLGVLFVIVVGKIARGLRDRARVRLPGAHGADDFREPGADRRVLVHPRRARRRARAAAAGRTRPDPGRRAAVDHAQSVRVRHDRADDALARSSVRALLALARTPQSSVTRRRRRRADSPACAITR